MKNLLKRIFRHPTLANRPPVLVDVGAATTLSSRWRDIAGYSICVAFDPDQRQMEYIESENGFKKMYISPAIVHESVNGQANFYLTASPECSSTLPPDETALGNYLFAPLFKREKIVEMPATTLSATLAKLELDYIDWFKTDSQGTDLRLFRSIPETIRRRTVAAEFEPGIIDAYKGEDKLWALLQFMENEPFWCNEINVLGNCRIKPGIAGKYFTGWRQRLLNTVLTPAPGWSEITFLNNFSGTDMGMREHLLGWVFATVMRQYGAALQIAENGLARFNEELFRELIEQTVKTVNRKCIFNLKIPAKGFKWLLRHFSLKTRLNN